MLSTKYRLVLQFGHSFLQNYYKPFFFDLLKAFLGLFLFLFFCWKGWRGKICPKCHWNRLLLPLLQLLSACTNNFWKNSLPFKTWASLKPLKATWIASSIDAFSYRKWENCQYKGDLREQTFSCELVEGQWIHVQPFLSPEESDTHCRWIWTQSASPKDCWKQPLCVCSSLHNPQPLNLRTVQRVPALLLLKQISYWELTMNQFS